MQMPLETVWSCSVYDSHNVSPVAPRRPTTARIFLVTLFFVNNVNNYLQISTLRVSVFYVCNLLYIRRIRGESGKRAYLTEPLTRCAYFRVLPPQIKILLGIPNPIQSRYTIYPWSQEKMDKDLMCLQWAVHVRSRILNRWLSTINISKHESAKRGRGHGWVEGHPHPILKPSIIILNPTTWFMCLNWTKHHL